MGTSVDYDVFISYSRELDRDAASRLQGELQRFARPWYRPRARTLRVYRDQTNLPWSPDLWGTLEQALSSSKWLVLAASPRSAQSQGVRRELDWWLEQKSPASICIALMDGEIRWDNARNDFDWTATTAVSPEALRRTFTHEPVWIDLRPLNQDDGSDRRSPFRRLTRSPADPRLQDAAASLIAEVKDKPKDELIGEHLRRVRQTRRTVAATLLILVLLLAAAVTGGLVARAQRDQAVRQATISEAGQLAAIAQTLTGSNLDLAELFAVEAYHLYPDSQTRAALFGAATAAPHLVRYLSATGTVTALASSADGRTAVAGTVAGEVLRWNLTDYQRNVVARLPAGITGVSVSQDGATIAAAAGDSALVWVRGEGTRRVPVPSGETIWAVGVSPAGQYAAFSLYQAGSGTPPSVLLIDERTGRSVTAQIQVPYPAETLSFDGETQLVVLAGSGAWERLAIPGMGKVSGSGILFGAHDYAQAMSATGTFFSWTNGGSPLAVGSTLLPPTAPSPLAAAAVGDAPDALAISADGRAVADADAGTIYVSGTTTSGNASSSTPLPLTGNTTINKNDLTFVGLGHDELLSASGALITMWDLNQYSRITWVASADVPSGCFACAGPRINVSPDASHAIITVSSASGAVLISLPQAGRSAQAALEGATAYGPALWSPDSREFSILTPPDGGGEVWSVARQLNFIRDWPTRPGASPLPDTGYDAPVSLVRAPGSGSIVEIDAAGNIIIRNPVTGSVERQVAGQALPFAPSLGSQYQAAVDSTAKYAAAIGPTKDALSTRVDVVNVGTGAITRLPGGAASGVAYDGQLLLVQRTSGTLEVWSEDGRRLIRSFAGDANATAGPVVNRAGLAVEVNSDGAALVYDVGSGQKVGSIMLPAGGGRNGTGVAFAPDGQDLVSATEGSGQVTEWSFSPGFWSAVACTSAGHSLTSAEWLQYVGTGGPGRPTQMAC